MELAPVNKTAFPAGTVLLWISMAAALLSGCGSDTIRTEQEPRVLALPATSEQPETHRETARRLMEGMSDDEILSQVFLLGYSGTTPTKKILDWISTRNIGGVKIFGWNAVNLEELAASITTMQKAAAAQSGIPLLIATDQEGGWVRHVKGETTETPGNMAIGASGLPYDAYLSGYYIGRELHALGINMNFAPTTDVYTNHEAHVIGPRSFSSDPVQVGELAIAYFKGLRKAGIISTAKHFPGHGNTPDDSHGRLPVIQDDLDTLWNRELLPYRFLIREGIPAIMSGHLSFPKITGDKTPASLSAFFETELLRNRLGFTGIIITDDLYMNGANGTGISMGEICVKALEAGNDMIMLSTTPGLYDTIWLSVRERYMKDPAFRDSIRASVLRILTAKIEYMNIDDPVPLYPDPGKLAERIPDPEGKEFFFSQACRSVTVIKDARIPLETAAAGRVLVVTPFGDFYREALGHYRTAARFPIPLYDHSPQEAAQLARVAGSYDTVIFCLVNEYGLEYLKYLNRSADRLIVFSMLTPVFLKDTPWVTSALAVYGWSPDSYRAGFAVIKGDIAANGKLPITLGPDIR